MTSKLNFNDLNVNMSDQDSNLNLDFGSKSMVVIGDFYNFLHLAG